MNLAPLGYQVHPLFLSPLGDAHNVKLNTLEPEQLVLNAISMGFIFQSSLDCLVNIQAEYCFKNSCLLTNLPPINCSIDIGGMVV